MGAYRYLQEIWRKKQSDVMKFLARIRTWEYRQRPPIVRVSRPTRPDKAHRVGYKAKNGFVVYRVKIRRGGRRKNASKGIVYGKPSNSGIYLKHGPNLQALAEQKIGRRLPSLRILNSYWVAQDYVHKYFEVILIDPANKVIRDDPRISWICGKVHREMRGVTAAGKKHRGLTVKGHKANHNRPSRRANTLRHKKVSLRRYR